MGSTFRRGARFFLPLTVAFAALPVRAEEPVGCDMFKWPIARQQAALAAEAKPTVQDGGSLTVGKAVRVQLAPVSDIRFAQAPERDPAAGTFAAVLNLAGPPGAGVYTVSLSGGAWIDVFQDNFRIRPTAFSGARDCPNIRKTLKFQFSALSTVIQISNVAASEISIVVLPE